MASVVDISKLKLEVLVGENFVNKLRQEGDGGFHTFGGC